MKQKPRTPIEELTPTARALYQFGLSFCEERGIPHGWLRLYASASIHADHELFEDGFFEVRRPSFAEYARRRYHIRLISAAIHKTYHVTWSTPRVWLEAPSRDDLRNFFPGWAPPLGPRTKDITLNAVSVLPRLLVGLYTMPKHHAYKFDPAHNQFQCERCNTKSPRGASFGTCIAPEIYSIPLPRWIETESLWEG